MFTRINNVYNTELTRFDNATTGGEERLISGEVFEHTLDELATTVGLTSVKGDYDYINPDLDGLTMDLQVDRHIFDSEGNRFAFVECKTYLDASMLKRAMFDLLEIATEVDDPTIRYGVFAGQNAVKDVTLNYYKAFFQKATGLPLEVFFVNEGKRTSSKPFAIHRFPLIEDRVDEVCAWLS